MVCVTLLNKLEKIFRFKTLNSANVWHFFLNWLIISVKFIKIVGSYFVMIVAEWCIPQCCTLKVFYHQAQNWKVQDCTHLIIWQKHFCLSAFEFLKRGFLGIVCVFQGRNSIEIFLPFFFCTSLESLVLSLVLVPPSNQDSDRQFK